MQFKVVIKPQRLQQMEFTPTTSHGSFTWPEKQVRAAMRNLTTLDAILKAPLLKPFEYSGLAQTWIVEIKKEENDPFTVKDLSVQFTCSARSNGLLKKDVIEQRKNLKRAMLLPIPLPAHAAIQPDGALLFTCGLSPECFPGYANSQLVLTNIGCGFVFKSANTAPEQLHYQISCDQYVGDTGIPVSIEVAALAPPDDDARLFCVASSEGENAANPNPLNALISAAYARGELVGAQLIALERVEKLFSSPGPMNYKQLEAIISAHPQIPKEALSVIARIVSNVKAGRPLTKAMLTGLLDEISRLKRKLQREKAAQSALAAQEARAWIYLLKNDALGARGCEFSIRVNPDKNEGFNPAQLAYMLLLLTYDAPN